MVHIHSVLILTIRQHQTLVCQYVHQPRYTAAKVSNQLCRTGLLFEASAAKLIAHFSGGVPRLVNILAHKCLMLAYGEDEHRVNVHHVRLAAADTPGLPRPLPWWSRWMVRW